MKKILLIAIIFFSVQGHAQKTLEIFNFSNSTVNVTDIITNASGAYPEFSVKYFGPIVLPPVTGSYVLQTTHPTRFPFDSPTSSPYIGSWERLDSATAPIFMMTGYGAWLMGDPQGFDRMEFNIAGNNYTINTTNTASSPITGPGFGTAEFDSYSGGGITTYTIVILP